MARKSFSLLLADMARYNPNGLCVTCGQRRITWKDMNTNVNRLSNALKQVGVRKGMHVSLMFHDCPEFIEVNYALQKLGAVPIPVNFRFVAREIEYQLKHSDSEFLIFEDLFAEEVEKAIRDVDGLKKVIYHAQEGGKTPEGMIEYRSLLSNTHATEPEPCTDEHDVCTICYTGGTTGLPKGVVLTYANFWHLAESLLGDLLGRIATNEDVNFGRIISTLLPLPGIEKGLNALMKSHHVREHLSSSLPRTLRDLSGSRVGPLISRLSGGLSLFMNMPLFHMANYQLLVIGPMSGLTRFILREGIHFDPREVLETMERERPMALIMVPTQWKMVLDHPDLHRYDRSSVLVAMTGAGASSAERKRQILGAFPNAFVMDVFGQTEMTPDTTIRIDASAEQIKNKAVGKPLSGIRIRIVDEDGKDLPQGQIGEILYNSATIMKEYYSDQVRTSEVIRDGWFHSGDLGYFDEDGELLVVDRKGECINTGAEKVYPLEVEEIIAQHEKVDTVCVIGIPDETWGHAVRAVIVLKQGETASEEEIIQWCKDKMTGYKRPKSVVFTEELPLSPVGKVLRSKIREQYGRV
ncbi:MAG: AMP-binding protein [Desulfomonilia bacterium]